jgi:hypothetical protein
MPAGPGVRRKDKSLRVGAITLDQRHREKNGEISGKRVGRVERCETRHFSPNRRAPLPGSPAQSSGEGSLEVAR